MSGQRDERWVVGAAEERIQRGPNGQSNRKTDKSTYECHGGFASDQPSAGDVYQDALRASRGARSRGCFIWHRRGPIVGHPVQPGESMPERPLRVERGRAGRPLPDNKRTDSVSGRTTQKRSSTPFSYRCDAHAEQVGPAYGFRIPHVHGRRRSRPGHGPGCTRGLPHTGSLR